jgi:hypothetical protein
LVELFWMRVTLEKYPHPHLQLENYLHPYPRLENYPRHDPQRVTSSPYPQRFRRHLATTDFFKQNSIREVIAC